MSRIDPAAFFFDPREEDTPPPPFRVLPDAPPTVPADLQAAPYSPGAEKSILSALFQYPERISEVGISPDHFHLPGHRIIFAAMQEIHAAGREVELVGFVQHLHDRGLLDRIGGPGTLTDIYTYAPSGSYVDSHLRILAEKYQARLALSSLESLRQSILDDPSTAQAVVARATTEFQKIAEVCPRAKVDGIKTTAEILSTNIEDDETMLIGPRHRFLGRGGSLVIAGPSGIGKSTLTAGFLIHAAAGRPWHGIAFRRPLKILVVQAENDDGDLAEMIKGAIYALEGMTMDQIKLACANILWRRMSTVTGEDFTKWLEAALEETKADLAHLDPILAYVGDDISLQKVASHFFRNCLQPVLDRTGAMTSIVHHTGKTSTDSKSRENWSESDFAYLGFGSSELTNWARAVAVLVPHGKDTGRFKFLIAKRGKRAGMIDAFSKEPATSIILEHSGKGMGWVQALPDGEEAPPRASGAKQKFTSADIFACFKDGNFWRKDVLIADLCNRFACSERLAREKVDQLVTLGKIAIESTEKRPEGGHPIIWLRLNKPTPPPPES